MRQIILFVDVDGVLSISDPTHREERREHWEGAPPVWPVPLALALVRAINQEPRLHPVWLTTWEYRAWHWNERAGTPRWPVGYQLTNQQLPHARRLFPELDEAFSDDKLLAVRYYLRRRPHERVIWIEDGFAPATWEWAARDPRVCLVDTTEDHVLAALLAAPIDQETSAREFLTTYLL
jgi:hypothetical protein